jgi:hypothetical protein
VTAGLGPILPDRLKKLQESTGEITRRFVSMLENPTNRWRTVCTKPNNAADALQSFDALPIPIRSAGALRNRRDCPRRL